jgi:hypothetical protein
MYQLITAIAKALAGDERWSTVDIGNIPLDQLFSTYSKIYATLSNPFLTSPIGFDLATIREEFGGMSITFNEFLTLNDNNTLVAMAKLPVLNKVYARYNDGFKAGYTIEPIHPTAAFDSPIPLAEKIWLRMTKSGIDYSHFYQSCLVNVNGFFHLTDYDVNGVYVVDGMKSCFMSKQNHIGIYSFNKIGSLQFIPIKAEMIYKQNPDQSLGNKAFIDIGQDVSNKSVFLVLGGYLHALDTKTFFQVSPSAFAIDFNNLPFLDRYYESRRYIDLSSLPLSKTNANPSQIAISEFFGDDSVRAYLTLSQSFFVILNNNDIFIERDFIQKTKFPDMYVSYTKPEYPLIVGTGKATNFWSVYEDKQYAINCNNAFKHNPLYNTIDLRSENSVADNRLTLNPKVNSDAFLLKIGTEVQ